MSGCIDGTSINIRTPAHKIKSTYTNRYDTPSITLQGICDFRKRFIDVFTCATGKIHDCRVFRLSDISLELPRMCGRKYHLIGDSAYHIREYLLTPNKNYGTLTASQINYNKKLSACRVLNENCFGLLKCRFRHYVDIHKVSQSTKFFISCCVLHNLCIDRGDFIDFEECEESMDNSIGQVADSEIQLRRLGERKRDVIRDSLMYL